MSSFALPHNIRIGQANDLNLIYKNWLRSYHDLSDVARLIPKRVYYPGQSALIKKLLQRCDVLVACMVDDPDQVYGWICFEPNVMHYVFVKSLYRKCGVGSALIEAAFPVGTNFCFSHHTFHTRKRLFQSRNSFYNPYFCMEVS
jgi:GNAT superfamily N-acetyltransferase